MADTIHIAVKGDTLWDLSRKYYGVPTRYEEIINNNQFFQDRRKAKNLDSTGIPFVFIGDRIVIVRDESPAEKAISLNTTPKNINLDGVTMLINGIQTEFSDDTKVIVNFDTCCNSFSTTRSWDPYDLDQRKLWNPLAPPDIEIWIKDQQILGGIFEEVHPDATATKASLDLTARTHTLKLEKSVFPLTAYPIERENENLTQIVEWATGVFGLGSADLSEATSEYKTKFLKSSGDNNTTAWEYLNKLATTKGRVLNCSPDGKVLRIVQPQITDSVARFQEGVHGFSLPKFKYNTANLKGNYIGSSETTKKPDNLETFVNPHFDENTYGFFNLDDSTTGSSQDSLSYQALKEYRDFFTTSFIPSGSGFFTPDGKLYEPGQIITMNAPSSMIYDDTKFMIRGCEYVIGAKKQHVILHILPPEVYLGLPVEKLPFDTA